MSVLVPMTEAFFATFKEAVVAGYARENVAAGRWPADSARTLSQAEHERLLPAGLTTPDAHLFEIRDPETDAAVGSLWLVVQTVAGARSACVVNVEVDQAHRRKGLARRAFEEVEPFARDLGLASIGLHVFAFNGAARSLYEGLGYDITGLTMRKPLARKSDGD